MVKQCSRICFLINLKAFAALTWMVKPLLVCLDKSILRLFGVSFFNHFLNGSTLEKIFLVEIFF